MVSLRITFILITLLVVAIPASAEEDPYYLRANVGPADAPREATSADDCSPKRGPEDVDQSARVLVAPIVNDPPSPTGVNGVSAWFPTCTTVTTALPADPCDDGPSTGCRPVPTACVTPLNCPPSSRAAYNMTSGRVYLEHGLDTSALGVLGVTGMNANLNIPDAFTVGTGIGFQADCEQCPPVP